MLLFRSSKIFYSDLQIVLVNIKKMAYSPNDNSLIVLDSSPEFAKTIHLYKYLTKPINYFRAWLKFR